MSDWKNELVNAPKWDKQTPLKNVNAVYLLTTRRKHDSGYAVFKAIVSADTGNKGKYYEVGDNVDSIRMQGAHFNAECIYPENVFSIYNDVGFNVCPACSTIWLVEEENNANNQEKQEKSA